MKYIPFSFILFVVQLYSQHNNDSIMLQKKWEVKIAPIQLLNSKQLAGGFEYFQTKDISFGITGLFNLKETENDFDYYYSDNIMVTYQFTPFIRYSLSKKQTSLFYLEGYLNTNGGKYRRLERLNDNFGNGYYIENTKKYTDFGIGFGGGYKFYVKKTLGIDFNFGLARNLFQEESLDVIPKASILFSYRF